MTNKEQMDDIRASLKERIKELECLYSISQITNEMQNRPINEVFGSMVKVLPKGWQYPEITHARITFDGDTYVSEGFIEGVDKQTEPLMSKQIKRGLLEIIYTEERPEKDEGPFLKEERALINNIAKKLSMIIERTEERKEKEILESKLIHADRLATVGELTAGIAHELNEPLGSILGFAQLIKSETEKCPQITNDIDKIVQASLHAREVIRKLMTFSRYDEKPSDKINLNSIIQDGLYLLESRCKKEDIEIVRTLEKDLPEIFGNPVQMHQVVVNLCVNAIQAMPNGGKLVLHTYSSKKKINLVVQDTGMGISNDQLEKIFNPFFTTKDSNVNSGLGLSVVHGIVNSFNGKITVESNLGVGTRFQIAFPEANQDIEK